MITLANVVLPVPALPTSNILGISSLRLHSSTNARKESERTMSTSLVGRYFSTHTFIN